MLTMQRESAFLRSLRGGGGDVAEARPDIEEARGGAARLVLEEAVQPLDGGAPPAEQPVDPDDVGQGGEDVGGVGAGVVEQFGAGAGPRPGGSYHSESPR